VRSIEEAVREHAGQAEAASPSAAAATVPRLRPPGLVELEELLGDHLETRVKISMSAKQGRLTVDFADLEDLERIYRRMTGGPASQAQAR
jgi:ParB family chromosome partitioning protein